MNKMQKTHSNIVSLSLVMNKKPYAANVWHCIVNGLPFALITYTSDRNFLLPICFYLQAIMGQMLYSAIAGIRSVHVFLRWIKKCTRQKSSALYGPGIDPRKINGILHQVALKRMAKRQDISNPMENAGLPEGKLGIGSIKNQHCHTVSSNPDHRWICIKCKLGAAKDRPHLVINVSLYISVILTDNKNDHECSDIEIHHLPPTSQHTNTLKGTCLIAYRIPSRRRRCSTCLTRALSTRVKVQKITDSWLLFDASDDESNGKAALVDDVLNCHRPLTCRRIQMVPHRFCSAHRAFLSPETLSEKPSANNKFTRSFIPVGICPPKYQATVTHMEPMTLYPSHVTRDELQCNAGLWTAYNSIAFVEFDTERLKQVSCVVCLIQHSEVFIVYWSRDKKSGYVWMRQAPSKVLQMCLKEHCKSLTYDEKREQIERPNGLRPWTSFDVQSGK
uniref:AlNc14C525G12046 protein n=1 Tax=Albugo laibachii Nc14 TaxID=890382 RepID=F0X0V6_9STRA|nr:AlNc14C525G12046 [Albugo laibachii Nc14]|eukprot:CCA27401.1 AlNc14C525G12046 [Albugo laibachii Nc14]